MEYVWSMLPEMLALVGAAETRTLVGHAGRLIGMQLYDETAARLGVRARDAAAFAGYLSAMARAQGEEVEVDTAGREAVVLQAGWRLMRGIEPLDPAAFDGWNGLWEGALSVHNRRLTVTASRPAGSGGGVEWRIGS